MAINWVEIIGVIFGMAILSYSFKPNPIHRFVECIYIGTSAGYILMTNLNSVYDKAIIPLSINPLLIIPLMLGLLMYIRLVKEHAWISRYPIAFLTGIGTAISLRTVVDTDIIKQLQSTFVPLFVSGNMEATISNIVIAIAVPTVLSYFFYTHEQRGPLGISTNIGVKFIMIAFGATVATSMTSRVARLVSFVQELLIVPSAIYMIPIMVIAIFIATYPEKLGIGKK